MNDNFEYNKFSEEIQHWDFTIIQRPSDKRINSTNVRIDCLSPAVIKKGSQKEKALITEWNEVFPKLDNVKYLKIDVYNQEIFDGMCKIPNLEKLTITNSNFTNLTSIHLFKNLNRFELIRNNKITDVEPLSKLRLEYLKFEECFNISNYEIIGNLKTLIGLSINGNWTAPKNLKLNSIKTFENLNELVHLDIELCSLTDNSFDSILKMEKLKRFDYLGKVDKKTVLNIKNNHKNLCSGSFIN
ncbi:hypothetical protein [Flavobacterium sp. HNIBRBA15423]|uniref:hypothetical protein n=1 Tax=Flavobacterium sp. HNIBRBA15423 TaxID=3458683 RepID=UPI0040440CAE